ncbi:hypothetical protein NC651_023420 [Populus alba x Populus x berolinensis]|nr:hypothetical protein NC651_023420 [Populus alba x Populus x berolinensis]
MITQACQMHAILVVDVYPELFKLACGCKPSSDRVGPLVVLALINDSVHSSEKVNTALDYQEYPPEQPSLSTQQTWFVFAPESVKNKCEDYNFVAHGDALIVDPGCRANFHKEVFLSSKNAILMPLY